MELNRDKYECDIWSNEGIFNNTITKFILHHPCTYLDMMKCDDWVSTGAKIQLQKAFNKFSKTAPKSIKMKTSVINAIEIPHPGLSYNPRPEDHQELISEVIKKEVEMIKKEEHLKRVTKDVFKSIPLKKHEVLGGMICSARL